MSHIVSIVVNGLAGRSKPLTLNLKRDINIFFGLNGSGKTSLLKILHAAMANETEILQDVPFLSAEVKIYSQSYDAVFTRSIEKAKLEEPRIEGRGVVRRETVLEELAQIDRAGRRKRMRWESPSGTPADAAKTHWSHQYLPTSRLHVTNEPIYLHMEMADLQRSRLTEERLDGFFAKSVQQLWSRYSSEVLIAVRTAQEQGLARILRAVLSPQSESKRRKSKLTSSTAYKRVRAFLERQGSATTLGSQSSFEKRYISDPTLQDVVQDIDAVEDKIEFAMKARSSLQELVGRMFSNNKEIAFTDKAIEVKTSTGEQIGLASLSSGEKHLLRLMVEMLLVDKSSLMIDEPEISLHVDWQRNLVKSLRALNEGAQLILATHSPEVMADIPDENIFHI